MVLNLATVVMVTNIFLAAMSRCIIFLLSRYTIPAQADEILYIVSDRYKTEFLHVKIFLTCQ